MMSSPGLWCCCMCLPLCSTRKQLCVAVPSTHFYEHNFCCQTAFEQRAQSPKFSKSFAELLCYVHCSHSPTSEQQLGQTFIDYLHLMLRFCLMDCLRGIFQNTCSPHLHTYWNYSFCFSYGKIQYSDGAILGENIQLLFPLAVWTSLFIV